MMIMMMMVMMMMIEPSWWWSFSGYSRPRSKCLFFNFIINLVRTLVLIEMSVLGEKTISATQHRLDLSQLKQVFPVKEYFNIVYIYFSSPSYGLYTAVTPTWDRHSFRSPFSGFLQHWPLDFPGRSSPWNRDGNCKQCSVHCGIWYGGGGGLQSFWDLGWGAGSKVLEVFKTLVEGRVLKF